jgi:hypothetical protein
MNAASWVIAVSKFLAHPYQVKDWSKQAIPHGQAKYTIKSKGWSE